MSSMWDVVIWSRHAKQLMPELEKFADNHDHAAAFRRPGTNDGHMGFVDIITGEVNHLDPDALLQIVKDVHAAEWFTWPATVLLSCEYDLGDPPRVHQLYCDSSTWSTGLTR